MNLSPQTSRHAHQDGRTRAINRRSRGAPVGTVDVIDENDARVFIDDALNGYLTGKLLDASLAHESVIFTLNAEPR